MEIRLLLVRPTFQTGEAFFSYFLRTIRAQQIRQVPRFLRRRLGFDWPFDPRFPPEQFIEQFANLVFDPGLGRSPSDLVAQLRAATLWSIADAMYGQDLGAAPPDDPLLASAGAVCPSCLQIGGLAPRIRQALWQVGVITVCLKHEVLLTDRCKNGASLGGDSLGWYRGQTGRLPISPAHHPRNAICPGCDLSDA